MREERDPFAALERKLDRRFKPTKRDLTRYREVQRLEASGLSHDEAIRRVKAKYPTPVDRLWATLRAAGYDDQQITEYFREHGRTKVLAMLEAERDRLRKQNARPNFITHERRKQTNIKRGFYARQQAA